jgi:hypothetical protein
MGNHVPEPSYNYQVNQLVRYYQSAIREIMNELNRLDLTDMSRAQSLATMQYIARILRGLNGDAAEWVERNVPIAARDGAIRAIVALGVVNTVAEAEAIVKFNRMNQNMVASVVADLQSDLLAVTKNVDRKVRSTVRQVVADTMRANVTAGINGRRSINRDILRDLRSKLGESVNTGLVDAAGKRWRPEVYVDLVSRTKMMYAHTEATTNEAINRGVQYGVISSHGATDACRNWEGKIVKLTPDAPGNYPTADELRRGREIFHPNCRHVISPIRDPETLHQ